MPPPDDPDAWLTAHGDALFRFAALRVRDAATAEDLVQETFLAALTQRDFRGDAAERTWLTAILRHKVCDHLRRRCRELPLAPDAEGDATVDGMFRPDGHWKRAPLACDYDPAQLSENAAFWAAFRHCRDALPERQAAVFVRRCLDDAPAEAVCQELGISAANLWVLLHRARTRLRACLEAGWFGGERKEGP
jgi:RNA polymerase sigma-70 factor (ECF subfamily)